MAHEADRCSSCLAGSEYLLNPVGTFGSCDAVKTKICSNLESCWNGCTDHGFCEMELDNFYQCTTEALAARNFGCDEDECCHDGVSTTREMCIKNEQPKQHRELFLEGPIQSISIFFTWLLNLFDIFNIIPNYPIGPTPAPAPTVSPAPTPDSFNIPLCQPEYNTLFNCLKSATTPPGCYACLRNASPSVDELLPLLNTKNLKTCDDWQTATCVPVRSLWNKCQECGNACSTPANNVFECLLNVDTRAPDNCGDTLNCFTECFSPSNMVDVKDKGTIPIDELQIGDLVCINGNGGYSRVYSFGHLDRKSTANYLQIFAEGLPQPLEISPNHLLSVNSKLAPAFQVKKGDVLNGIDNGIKVSRVTSIQRRGKYAPLTESGTIRVSGVDASSYVYLSPFLPSTIVHLLGLVSYNFHHVISHGWTAPLRWACALSFDICKDETYKNGYASWFYATLQFTTKLGETPKLVQIAFALFVAPFLLVLYSPLVAAVVLLSMYWYMYRNFRSKLQNGI